jgi:hypothetical protein
MDNITINPLLNLISNNQALKPKWLCNHIDAKIIDYDKKYYKCKQCMYYGTQKKKVVIVSLKSEILTSIIRNELK